MHPRRDRRALRSRYRRRRHRPAMGSALRRQGTAHCWRQGQPGAERLRRRASSPACTTASRMHPTAGSASATIVSQPMVPCARTPAWTPRRSSGFPATRAGLDDHDDVAGSDRVAGATLTLVTVPEISAWIWFSIFMASRIDDRLPGLDLRAHLDQNLHDGALHGHRDLTVARSQPRRLRRSGLRGPALPWRWPAQAPPRVPTS